MEKTVLLEGLNLMLTRGTGIATYANHLADAIRANGHRAELIFSTSRAFKPIPGDGSEIPIFDAIVGLPPSILDKATLALRHIIGFPFGLPLDPIILSGLVVDPRIRMLSRFERLYAVAQLPDMAKAHFKRFETCAELKPPVAPDLFHATCPIPLRVKRCPNIYTIHDLIPIRLPQTTLDEKGHTYRVLRFLARTADHIVTVSENSKRDIIKYLKVPEDRVTNTYQAVGFPPELCNKPVEVVSSELQSAFDVEFKNYFIYVGAIEPKKNVSRLIDGYLASGSRRPLIIVGAAAWQYENDLAKIKSGQSGMFILDGNEIRPKKRVRHLEYLPKSQVVNLIRGARALLFPSLYEGFGLPVVEAMLLGTPVLTSKTSSMPEISGNAALLVDPHDVEEISAGIRALDFDNDLVEELRDRGLINAKRFSVDIYRDRVNALYSKLM